MRYYSILFSLIVPILLLAQPEMSIIGDRDLMQSDVYNPAYFHHDGCHVSVPGILYNFFHTGPGYNRLINHNTSAPVLKLSALRSGLKENNYLYADLRFQTFKIKYGTGKLNIGLDHEILIHNAIKYPKELIELYLDGNQPFIGRSIQIGPAVQTYTFNSYGLNLSYQLERWTLGLKPRLLFGNQFARTPRSSALLSTSDDIYQVTLETDFQFDNVGLISFQDANFLNYQIEQVDRWRLFSKNVGFALDMGLHHRISQNLTMGLSLIDWGSIHWSEAVRSFISKQTVRYDGAEVVDLFGKDQIGIEGALDSLKIIFDLVESTSAIKFRLPTKWIFVANYQVLRHLDLALVTLYQKSLDQPLVLALRTSTRLTKEVKIGTTISNRYNQFNLGLLGQYSRPKWILYAATDQLLGGINPTTSNQFNLRLGLNFHLSGTSFD